MRGPSAFMTRGQRIKELEMGVQAAIAAAERVKTECSLYRQYASLEMDHAGQQFAGDIELLADYALVALAGAGGEEQAARLAVHCWCGKSNLDLPLSNWCRETRDWGTDGAGRQVDYECVSCKRKVSVNLQDRHPQGE